MRGVFLLLGTNLGDREFNLDEAIRCIRDQIGDITGESSIYETSAWGIENQPDFLNQVVKIRTMLTPDMLLKEILKIEKGMGRERIIKWGSRLIDIDILFFDDLVINLPNLVIPHPEFKQRKFALAPMAEIASAERYPQSADTIALLYQACKDNLPVRLFKSKLRIVPTEN